MSTITPSLNTPEEFDAAFKALRTPGKPSFFALKAPLPFAGRTDTAVAASGVMTVSVKCYASGGENELHAHTTEDHIFLVLQGQAQFFGPEGETRVVSALEGVMLPHGSFYRFQAVENETLVMVRIGCVAATGGNMSDRIGLDGQPMAGNSKENRQVPTVLSGAWFGPTGIQ